jgi:hypothetical protein
MPEFVYIVMTGYRHEAAYISGAYLGQDEAVADCEAVDMTDYHYAHVERHPLGRKLAEGEPLGVYCQREQVRKAK